MLFDDGATGWLPDFVQAQTGTRYCRCVRRYARHGQGLEALLGLDLDTMPYAIGCKRLLTQITAAVADFRASGAPDIHAVDRPVRLAVRTPLQPKRPHPGLAEATNLPRAGTVKTHEKTSLLS
jgi:hypothetical protein